MSNQFYHTLVVVAATELIPMPAPATTNEPWWSYNVGLLHFVGTNHLRRNQPANDNLWRLSPGMSSEHDFHVGSKQYQWIEEDLKSVDRSVTPWIIFGSHRAMYLNSNYGSDSSETSDIGFNREDDCTASTYVYLFQRFETSNTCRFHGHDDPHYRAADVQVQGQPRILRLVVYML